MNDEEMTGWSLVPCDVLSLLTDGIMKELSSWTSLRCSNVIMNAIIIVTCCISLSVRK
jgi:hypothetical protein